MKIIIRNIDNGKYLRGYTEKVELVNDWVKDFCDATLINEAHGIELIKKLRQEGYRITFIVIKDIAKYERLTKLQREVKQAVKQAIRHRVGIVELVNNKLSASKGLI